MVPKDLKHLRARSGHSRKVLLFPELAQARCRHDHANRHEFCRALVHHKLLPQALLKKSQHYGRERSIAISKSMDFCWYASINDRRASSSFGLSSTTPCASRMDSFTFRRLSSYCVFIAGAFAATSCIKSESSTSAALALGTATVASWAN